MPKELTKDFLEEEFVVRKKSTTQIAQEANTHPTTIRRLLIKFGIPLRSKSEAQALALQSNRAKHPTEGRPRSEEDKNRIAKATYEYWKGLSEKEKAHWCNMKKKEWKALSDEEKSKRCDAAAKAIRQTVETGSLLEQRLCKELRALGYRVEFHKENFLLNTKLQTDILLPSERIAIEVDGIFHYEPIYGQEKFDKQRRADQEKNGLLLANGFHVVRLKAVYRTLAEFRFREYFDSVLSTIKELKSIRSPRIVHI